MFAGVPPPPPPPAPRRLAAPQHDCEFGPAPPTSLQDDETLGERIVGSFYDFFTGLYPGQSDAAGVRSAGPAVLLPNGVAECAPELRSPQKRRQSPLLDENSPPTRRNMQDVNFGDLKEGSSPNASDSNFLAQRRVGRSHTEPLRPRNCFPSSPACGTRKEQHAVFDDSQPGMVVASPLQESSRYAADTDDLLDQHIAYYLKHHPEVLQRHSIFRRRPGSYQLDGREVDIEWEYSADPSGRGYLVVIDGPLRQPFADYMEDTDKNAQYQGQDVNKSSLHMIPKDRRISFNDTHKVYSRLEAMKVAKEQALCREKAAGYIKEGKEIPGDIITKYNKSLQVKLGMPRQQPQQRQMEERPPAAAPAATPAPAASPAVASAAAVQPRPLRQMGGVGAHTSQPPLPPTRPAAAGGGMPPGPYTSPVPPPSPYTRLR
mmetsp:Transcript_155904/g.499841  ORF Transcript_155904/g.499841 Transcript_155904/m.499841 type:complete len:431 (+) Transcript_155904:76-1368(+)